MRAHCRVDRSEWWVVNHSVTYVGIELLGKLKILCVSPRFSTQGGGHWASCRKNLTSHPWITDGILLLSLDWWYRSPFEFCLFWCLNLTVSHTHSLKVSVIQCVFFLLLDKAPRLSISNDFWILSSDTICQLNQIFPNSEAAMLSICH